MPWPHYIGALVAAGFAGGLLGITFGSIALGTSASVALASLIFALDGTARALKDR